MASTVFPMEKATRCWPGGTQRRSRREEALLIRQILAGRRDLFGDLVEPYRGRVLQLIRARLRSNSDCEDILQQALLKALIHLKQFRFEASFCTWLSQIALNEVWQWHRGSRLSLCLALDTAGVLKWADQRASPLEQCEFHEAACLLHSAVARLPEKYQVVVRLRDFHDLTVAEVAHLLNINGQTVKTRHRRARLLMARYLSRHLAAARSLISSPDESFVRSEARETADALVICLRR